MAFLSRLSRLPRATATRLLGLTLSLAFAPAAHAWVADGAPLWPDGNVTLEIKLGQTPTYTDGTTPDTAARAALDRWNPLMQRVQLVGNLNSSVDSSWGNGRNNITFGSKIAGDDIGEGVFAVTLIDYDTTKRLESDIVVNANIN